MLVAAWRARRPGRGIVVLLAWSGLALALLAVGGLLSFVGVDYTLYGPAVAALTVAASVLALVASRLMLRPEEASVAADRADRDEPVE